MSNVNLETRMAPKSHLKKASNQSSITYVMPSKNKSV
jgi:hypothetical protein